MSTIIDTHTHLYDIGDIDSLLCSAAEAGVGEVVALGVDYSSNIKQLEIAQKKNLPLRVHLAWGIHPGNIVTDQIDRCFEFFRMNMDKVVAVGEVGLDFSYKSVRDDAEKKAQQTAVFERHLDLAKEFDLPIVIHSRGAERMCLNMALRAGIKRANFHWYSGPADVLDDVLAAGFFVSVSPAIEYSPESRRVAERAPLDRILVETDTPVRGWKPQDVWRTLDALCAIRMIDRQTALEAVNANARAFFPLHFSSK